jgi:hypothetical protein
VKDVDARLLRRLSEVSSAIGPVLLLVIEHWRNDPDGGLPPAADLRSVGKDLVTLGSDLIARADEVDRIVAGPSANEQDQLSAAPMDSVDDGSARGK